MIVKRAFIFDCLSLRRVHLRHLLEAVEHRMDDPIIPAVDSPSNVESLDASQLCLNLIHVDLRHISDTNLVLPLE